MYQTHNDLEINATGTHLQGHIEASYTQLILLFGEPTVLDTGKTDAEWIVKSTDGTVATVYNWKNGYNYLGDEGVPVHEMTLWNIGGHTYHALELIQNIVDETQEHNNVVAR